MQRHALTLKIELFGHLLEELNYWASVDDDIDLAEDKFKEVLSAIKEMREILLKDIEGYLNECRTTKEPINLNYVIVFKELKRATFSHI